MRGSLFHAKLKLCEMINKEKRYARKNQKRYPKQQRNGCLYILRYLNMLNDSGVQRIKSNEFSEITQVPSATIRRDFSHLGELGRSGYGYDVPI